MTHRRLRVDVARTLNSKQNVNFSFGFKINFGIFPFSTSALDGFPGLIVQAIREPISTINGFKNGLIIAQKDHDYVFSRCWKRISVIVSSIHPHESNIRFGHIRYGLTNLLGKKKDLYEQR